MTDLSTIHLGPLTPEAIPEPGGVVLATTDRDFSAWDWVPCMLASGRGAIERLAMTTFNVSFCVLEALANEMDLGRVELCDLLVSSEVPYQSGMAGTEEALARLATFFTGRFRWSARRTHAKVLCAWMESGDCLVVVGSGNLSSHNSRHEAYTVLNSRRAADHVARWIAEVMK